jgi:DNA (cytosine-5)-methyltransferase 1
MALRLDQPSKAITGGACSEFVHPTEHRYLTVRECARIQTFPDSFGFVGTASEQALLIGNAVPPTLAEVLARSLAIALCRLDPSETMNSGALLTFLPGSSGGMSPILEAVSERVRATFSPLRNSKRRSHGTESDRERNN